MSGLKNKSGDLRSHAGEPVYKANVATNTSEFQQRTTMDNPKIMRIIDIKNSQALIQMSNGLTRYIHTSFLVEHKELIEKYRAERQAELDGADVTLEVEGVELADAVSKLRKAGL